jgi:hypothetical protein
MKETLSETGEGLADLKAIIERRRVREEGEKCQKGNRPKK